MNLNKYECIQLFTYDAALLYLLKNLIVVSIILYIQLVLLMHKKK